MLKEQDYEVEICYYVKKEFYLPFFTENGVKGVLGKNVEKWLTYTLKYIGKTKPENQHCLLPEEWNETLA